MALRGYLCQDRFYTNTHKGSANKVQWALKREKENMKLLGKRFVRDIGRITGG